MVTSTLRWSVSPLNVHANNDLHFSKFIAHLEQVASLAESELPHELCNPDHIIARFVINVTVDDLDNPRQTGLEILAMIDPSIATLCRVASVNHLEETVEETLGYVLADEVWLDEAFELESVAAHASFINQVLEVRNTDNAFIDKILSTTDMRALVHSNDVWEALIGDSSNTPYDILDSTGLVLQRVDRVLNIVIVELLD